MRTPAIASLLALLAAPLALGQTMTITYELQDVWLDPDITHPWESPQLMQGTFEWTYTNGDFANGSGTFTSLTLPWYGDGMGLTWTFDTTQIDIDLPGNWHDWGVSMQIKFTAPLSPDGQTPVDVVLSKFEIEAAGINRQGHMLGGQAARTSPFLPFCAGDGTGTGCPCGNDADPGLGCANSSGQGTWLIPSGSASVLTDDLTFSATNLLPGQPALLFVGTQPNNFGLGSPLGDGLLCVGGSIIRLEINVPDASGTAVFGPGLRTKGGWAAGETRYFQAWYRDPNGSPCGSGSNMTSAVQVTFQ